MEMKAYVKTYLRHFQLDIEDVWRCEMCGKFRNIQRLEIHHILFRSHGGTDDIDNLAAVCRECHMKIHDKGVKFKLEDSIIQR